MPRPSSSILILMLMEVSTLGTMWTSGARVPGSAGGTLSHYQLVNKQSTFCQYRESIMMCDFKWYNEPVYVEAQPAMEGDLDKMLLRHVHNLTLDRSTCVDLSLTHVAEARREGEPLTSPSSCSKMKLTLRNVSLELLSDPVTSVYAHETNIKEVRLGVLEGQMTIIGSRLGVVDIREVRSHNSVSVKIHSTTIQHLQRLHVKESAGILLHNCTVEKASQEALVLLSTGNTLNKVKFVADYDTPPAGVVLTPGADVTLEDISGKVKISSLACPSLTAGPFITVSDHEPQTTLSETGGCNEERQTDENKFQLLCAILATSITVNIIFVCYINCMRKKNQEGASRGRHK
ncbi:uncharacterized protein LOC121862402 [Homarus americanus]|uniref:uncharacterized protein LOC121862402 n=1 Tax=Homarus americanus TaxID=6706 RepID=UPI001C444A50|nr:uncharacterized protein LOC121862402 [Homarus americanus]